MKTRPLDTKEFKGAEEGSISDKREYIINLGNNEYILIIKINEKNIYFILSTKNEIVFNFKNNMNLSAIVDKLALNQKKYYDLSLVLKLFDKIYENQKLFINMPFLLIYIF